MHCVSRLLLAASLAAFCFGQSYQELVQQAKSRIREMDVARLKTLQASGEKFALIDVREDNEWAAGHAQGAIHIGRGVLERDIEAQIPQKDARLVLYCGGGHRSALTADVLQKMGYTNVYSLAGGFSAYRAAGLPAAK